MGWLPNAISALRVPLGLGVGIASSIQEWKWAWWLFLAAALSDVIDGPLARKLNAVSDLGKRLDLAGDYTLGLSTFTGLTINGVFPWYSLAIGIGGAILLRTLAKRSVTNSERPSSKNPPAARRSTAWYQNAIGLAAVFCLALLLGYQLLIRAYGRHSWYLAVAAPLVVLVVIAKRGRLNV